MLNPFFIQGNNEALEQVKGLRLAKITSIDTDDMVAEIEFLEESSGKSRVPLPMPMAYPGGGIFSVPRAGAIVIVGVRAMQSPLILAYYPFNAFSPDSNYSGAKQVHGIPDEINEGDVFMRAASDSAKCVICGVTSLVAAFAANLDRDSLVELCPNCHAPAFTTDKNGRISTLNKQQLGMTLHMRSDGKLFFQGDNLADRGNGDAERLIKVVIDGVSGDVTVNDANDIVVTADGSVSLSCGSLDTTADGGISENSDTHTRVTTQEDVEEVGSKTITADETVIIDAQSITITADGIMNSDSDTLVETITTDHLYTAGTLTGTTDGARSWTVGTAALPADDAEIIWGSKTNTVGGSLGETITGGTTISIGTTQKVTVVGASTISLGSSSLTIAGASTTTVGGAYSLTITGTSAVSSTGAMTIIGATINLNSGTNGVARVADSVLSTITSDPTFWLFVNNLVAFLATFSADAPPFTASKTAAAIAAATVPASLTSLISTGSTTVKAGP